MKKFLQEFKEFIEIAEAQQETVGDHPVLFHDLQVLLHDERPTAIACGGCSSHAHGHEILTDITGTDAMDEQQAHEDIKVGCDTVGGVKRAILVIDSLPAIERWMGGHHAKAHHPTAEDA